MITTHEELDALPEGTVILNWVGWLLVRQGGGWVYLDGGRPPKASDMVPSVVIEQPAPEPEPVKVASNARGRHLTHWQIKSHSQAQKIRDLQEENMRLREKLERQEAEIARLIIDRDQARSNNAFNTYQEKTAQTAIYPGDQALQYLIPGLNAEAGEVAGKWAKAIRDRKFLYAEEVLAEVGDVLWFVSEIARYYGVSLDVVAERNLKKLADRKNRGVLKGSGDHR